MKNLGTPLYFIVGLFSVLGIAFSIGFLISGGANPQFEQFPSITLAHVIPGLIYLALAPLQFSKAIRSKSPNYHRWSGRLLVSIGLVTGAAALFLGIIIPFSGLPEQIVIGIFGIFFLLSIVKGFLFARGGNFVEHREWMMRAFAIALSIVTMRLIFIPILIAIGRPTVEQAAFYSIISFTIAFVVHSGFAEYWIRHTRKAGDDQVATTAVGT